MTKIILLRDTNVKQKRIPEWGITPPKKKLLDRVGDVLRLKHYSYRTEQSYVQCCKRL